LIFFLYGFGRNGKSTALDVLRSLFGEYARSINSEFLMATKGPPPPTEICDLYGARFAVANETEQGRKLAEVKIKALTGGDRLKGRRMREDFWEFAPSHKLWLAGHHKPSIVGTDDAIWDR